MEKLIRFFDYLDTLPEGVILLFLIYFFVLVFLLRLLIREFKSWQKLKRYFKPNKFK